MKAVQIYPAFDALYYSFYVQALLDYFGESEIEFSYTDFPPISSDYFGFFINGEKRLRVVIDAYDGSTINDSAALDWCHVFGKVNLVSSLIPNDQVPKCLAIGPSFPVKLWPFIESVRIALKNYRRDAKIKSGWEHFGNYVRQCRDRLPLGEFVPGVVRDNYIFFSSSIWREEEAPETNRNRATFMEICKSLNGVTFEGGFSPPESSEYADRYRIHLAPKRYPFPEWLKKIKSSLVVFNTPAVWLSHTFKLAEFLALGKAIISTPISRELPAPLVHGCHVHYVDGSTESIRSAVTTLIADPSYRTHLERNAYEYYTHYLQPKRVIERVLNHRSDDVFKRNHFNAHRHV